MSENFNDLFNLDPTKMIKDEKKTGDFELYRPNAKDGKDNVYKSIIKFIPWYKDPQNSIQSKWVVWLSNPDSEKAKMIDCPSTIGEKSILQEAFFALRKSASAQEQELASNFSRRENFFSIIQIIKDPNNEELEGTYKIFRYGRKVYAKLKSIMNPGDGLMDPNNPFDLFKGKSFMLSIKLVAGYNNYDDSQFLADATPIAINGETLEPNQENYDKITKFLTDNSPDLSKYAFKPWDEDTKQFILESIDAIIPPGKILNKIYKRGKLTKSRSVTAAVNKASAEVSAPSKKLDIDLDAKTDDFDDFLNDTPKKSPKKKKKIASTDADDFLSTIGIDDV